MEDECDSAMDSPYSSDTGRIKVSRPGKKGKVDKSLKRTKSRSTERKKTMSRSSTKPKSDLRPHVSDGVLMPSEISRAYSTTSMSGSKPTPCDNLRPNFNRAATELGLNTRRKSISIDASELSLVSPRRSGSISESMSTCDDIISCTSLSPRTRHSWTISDLKKNLVLRPSMDEHEIPQLQRLEVYGIATSTEGGKKMIYAGTMLQIVKKLLIWLVTEPNRKDIFLLVHCFVLCHRRFNDPQVLLDQLISLWNCSVALGSDLGSDKIRPVSATPRSSSSKSFLRVSKEIIEEFPPMDARQTQTGIMFFLSAWFEVQMSDFLEGPIVQKLEDFIQQMPSAFARPIKSKISSILSNKPPPSLYLFKPSTPAHKATLSLGKFGLFDMKPEQVADQWTLLDMRDFLKIKPIEFLYPGEHWNAMLQRSTMLSRWVASEVVQVPNVSRRAEVVERFLEIALRFLENKNFNGLMSVWGGLNSLSVHRLSKTHKKISRKHSEIRDALGAKLSEEYNFFQLRKAMEKLRMKKEPVVPWFELINKFRNWSDQYPDYVDTTVDAEPTIAKEDESSRSYPLGFTGLGTRPPHIYSSPPKVAPISGFSVLVQSSSSSKASKSKSRTNVSNVSSTSNASNATNASNASSYASTPTSHSNASSYVSSRSTTPYTSTPTTPSGRAAASYASSTPSTPKTPKTPTTPSGPASSYASSYTSSTPTTPSGRASSYASSYTSSTPTTPSGRASSYTASSTPTTPTAHSHPYSPLSKTSSRSRNVVSPSTTADDANSNSRLPQSPHRSSSRSKSYMQLSSTPSSPRISTSRKSSMSRESPRRVHKAASSSSFIRQGEDFPFIPRKKEKEEESLYINFGKVTLMGEQIITIQEYQTNLTPIQLYDPEMDNPVDSAIRMFLSHLPTYDDEILWKFSNTCQHAEVL
eukprot:TRINITY_DN1083_c0_g1_i1.p1 TRINITY_DN1083_c0_g1~~TRINITY_DN1083_c0_g1_i1.p1  ORF type:complete len:922 (-),score=109.22 TRINITY_DN1083_c0_g1_i1:86-2851(-)